MLHSPGALWALTLTFMPVALSAQQPASTPAQQYDQLALSTQLDRKGAPPFHLKIDAQLYSLGGKPAETGTIEEWWVTNDEYRIEINSGSLHKVIATGEPHQKDQPTRTSYLLDQLLEETETPLHKSSPLETVTVESRHFGKVDLECFLLRLPASLGSGSRVCADPGTENLRLKSAGSETVMRNSSAVFYATYVALSTKIAYLGQEDVSGKITLLKSFTPGAPGTPTLKPKPPSANALDHPSAGISGGVMAGKLLKKNNPEYPLIARQAHISGVVLLHAIITREGKIGQLFVLSSPDESLSNAAMVAVRNWLYQPYLLNGEPTEVDTTITINFNLN